MRRFNVTSSLPALSPMIAAGLLFAVAIALSVTPMLAQVDTGSITGTVTDPSGAVVGNAKVTLTNEGTGQSLTTTTGSDGLYKFHPGPNRVLHRFGDRTRLPDDDATKDRVNVSSAVLSQVALKPGQVTRRLKSRPRLRYSKPKKLLSVKSLIRKRQRPAFERAEFYFSGTTRRRREHPAGGYPRQCVDRRLSGLPSRSSAFRFLHLPIRGAVVPKTITHDKPNQERQRAAAMRRRGCGNGAASGAAVSGAATVSAAGLRQR